LLRRVLWATQAPAAMCGAVVPALAPLLGQDPGLGSAALVHALGTLRIAAFWGNSREAVMRLFTQVRLPSSAPCAM
jgi:hypothetical protein